MTDFTVIVAPKVCIMAEYYSVTIPEFEGNIF